MIDELLTTATVELIKTGFLGAIIIILLWVNRWLMLQHKDEREELVGSLTKQSERHVKQYTELAETNSEAMQGLRDILIKVETKLS